MSVPPPSLTLAKPTWNMFYGSSNFSETQKTDRRTKLQTHNTLKPDWGFSGISWLQTVKTLSCIWDTCLITLTGYCTLSFWTGTSFRWSKLRNKCLKRGEFFTREEIMTCLKTKSMGSESGWISTVKTDKKTHTDPSQYQTKCWRLQWSSYCSVWVTVSLTVGLLHICAELVLLVTAHVCVAHEVKGVVVNAHCWSNKVQLHLQREGGGGLGMMTKWGLCWFEVQF